MQDATPSRRIPEWLIASIWPSAINPHPPSHRKPREVRLTDDEHARNVRPTDIPSQSIPSVGHIHGSVQKGPANENRGLLDYRNAQAASHTLSASISSPDIRQSTKGDGTPAMRQREKALVLPPTPFPRPQYQSLCRMEQGHPTARTTVGYLTYCKPTRAVSLTRSPKVAWTRSPHPSLSYTPELVCKTRRG